MNICLFRKRSTTVTFYKEYFSRLPGYPQYDDNNNLQLAIYALIPGVGVLSADDLEIGVTAASADLTAALGKLPSLFYLGYL